MTDPALVQSVDDIVALVESILTQDGALDDFIVSQYHSMTNFLDNVLSTKLKEVCAVIDTIVRNSNGSIQKFTKDGVPIAPPTLLSIQQLRTIYTSVEILWNWGIKDPIQSIIEFELNEDHPKSLIISQDKLQSIVNRDSNVAMESLFPRVECLWQIIKSRVFSSMMMQRNLPRIIVSLIAIDYMAGKGCAGSAPSPTNANAGLLLHQIAMSPLKSLVVAQLRQAIKGKPWMKSAASSLLGQIIMSQDGLKSTLVAYLQGVSDDPGSLMLQINVVKLVTATPHRVPRDAYLTNIARQVVSLYNNAVELDDKVLMKVCVLLITRLAWLDADICGRQVLTPLLDPILVLYSSSTNDSTSSSVSCKPSCSDANAGDVIVYDESSIKASILALHGLLHLCPLQQQLLVAMIKLNLPQAIFHFCLQASIHCRSSPIVRLVQECCCCLLTHCDNDACVDWLNRLCINSDCNEDNQHADLEAIAWRLLPSMGAMGGIRLCWANGNDVRLHRGKRQLLSGVEVGSAAKKPKKNNPGLESNLAAMSLEDTLRAWKDGDRGHPDKYTRKDYAASDEDDVDPSQHLSEILHAVDLMESTDSAPSRSEIILEAVDVGKALCEVFLFLEDYMKSAPSPAAETTAAKSSSSSSESTMSRIGYSIASSFYLRCLTEYLTDNLDSSTSATPSSIASQGDIRKQISGLLVLLLPSYLPMEMLLRKGVFLVRLVAVFLQNMVDSWDSIAVSNDPTQLQGSTSETNTPFNQQIAEVDESYSDRIEILQCVLGLLSAILAVPRQDSSSDVGAETEIDKEKEICLRTTREPLMFLSLNLVDASLREMCSELLHQLLRRGCSQTGTGDSATIEPAEDIPAALAQNASTELLLSEDPAMRAMGIHNLLMAISKTQIISDNEMSTLIDILTGLLHDSESFVYLSALRALGVLADHQQSGIRTREIIFGILLQLFAPKTTPSSASSSSSSSSSSSYAPPNYRWQAMIGESLGMLLRRAGDAAPPLLPLLVATCIRIIRLRPTTTDEETMLSLVNMFTLRVSRPLTASLAEDSDEQANNNMNSAISSAVTAAEFVLYRQSAVSLLADAVACGGWAISRFVPDILDIAMGILRMQIDKTAKNVQVARMSRRSAAYLLRFAVCGLRQKLFHLAKPGHNSAFQTVSNLSSIALHSIQGKELAAPSSSSETIIDAAAVDLELPVMVYNELVRYAEDRDTVVRFHCECGIAKFEEMLAQQLQAEDSTPRILKIAPPTKPKIIEI